MVKMFETVLNIRFFSGNFEEAECAIQSLLNSPILHTIAFANPEFILNARKESWLSDYLNGCEYVFADGIGVAIYSYLNGGRIRSRITGTDFQHIIFKLAAKEKLSVLIYGGDAQSSVNARENLLASYPTLKVSSKNGYCSNSEVLFAISKIKPDIIMVCLGNPLQEKWICENAQKTNARLVFGNGGAVDFLSGKVKRAPKIMLNTNLEWLWRLGQDFTFVRIRRQVRLLFYIYLTLRDCLR